MTSTHLPLPCEARIGGIAGLAIRIGGALQTWGHRRARVLDREQLQLLYAAQREARQVIAERGDAHRGLPPLLR
jgi:hypothetical protein